MNVEKTYLINLFKGLFLILLFISKGFAGGIVKTPADQTGIKFTENKNQWDQKILFRAQLDGGQLFLEKNAFTYNFYDKETLRKNHIRTAKDLNKKTDPIRFHAFRMTFEGGNATVETETKNMTPDYCNFFIDNDKSKWAGNVKNYKEIVYHNIYNGINLQVLGQENSLKYNFLVSAGGDPSQIKLLYEGLESIKLIKGELRLRTSLNEMLEQKPYAYQLIDNKMVEVPCNFVLNNTTVRFEFPKGYNKGYELIIDPVLVFACSSGSIADNFGMTATYDSDGNLYSGGTVFGAGYPVTLGAYDPTWNGAAAYVSGRTDVVITKYDSSGVFLQYATYFGGSNSTEVVSSLIVNSQDELMLYGVTGSNNFPVTAGAYDVTFNGGTYLNYAPNGTEYLNGMDLYAAKFNSTGSTLLASTYIGGTLNDGVNSSSTLVYNYGDYYRGEIQTDTYGNFYIASCTYSTNFPVTPGVAQTANAGALDGVVFKMNSDLSSMIWSTYIGGVQDDACYALAVDDSLNVYPTGGTASNNFPVTAGALSTIYNGGITDGFISKLNSNGSVILNSSFIGTTAYDQSYFVQLDQDQKVYLLGQTQGVMPVSPGVYSNPNGRQFIWKLTNDLSSQEFTTVFGNGTAQINISPAAFLVDNCENIYVSGWGGHILLGVPTTGMPLTSDAVQPTTDGFNFYLFVLSTNATSLLYATYFGGGFSQEHVDGGTSRFDKKGIIYQSVCAGCGGNDDFPVTPGSWPGTPGNPNHNTQNNNCNNGVFKFDFQVAIADANFTVDYVSGCAPLTVQFQNQSTAGGTYLWDFGGGDTTSTILNPVHVFPTPGNYMVQLFVENPASCNVWDTAIQYVTVHPPITANFNYSTLNCTTQANFVDSSVVGPVSWLWYFGDGDSATTQNPTHLYDSIGTYNVQLIATTVNGCADTVTIPVFFDGTPPVSINPSDTICIGSSTVLNASGGISYSWSPATGLSDPSIANPTASPAIQTTYVVTIETVNASNDTCQQTLSTTIYVKDDLAAFTSDTSSGCTPLTIQFQNQSATTTEYLWDFGNGNTSSTVFNPTQTYTTPSTYTVQLFSKDTASCATWDTVVHTITVYPGINADFGFSSVPCSSLFTFYDSSATAPASWLWDFDDGGTSTLQNPSHNFGAAGIYDIQLISSTVNGCKDTTTLQINYNGATTFISAPDTICLGSSTQLLASGGFSYSWSPSSSLSSAGIPNPVASPASTTTYTVTIGTLNSLGDTCMQTQSTTVYVFDPTIYSLSATADLDTIPEGSSTVLHAITDSSLTVQWSPANSVSDPTSFNPTVTPEQTTTYTVSILDSTGCPRRVTVTVYVVSMQCSTDNVFVPNTFTPNGDGENDVLFVRSNDVDELYFAVYNRWGQMVFETTDITVGWNGIYKGMKADPAVFAWYLRAKCFNGNELEKKGNTTLIR
jgi:gliding motility-associated-like protein